MKKFAPLSLTRPCHLNHLKHYPGLFKIPTMGRWMVVATGPQLIDDIRRASDDQLSFTEAISEVISPFFQHLLPLIVR